MLNLAPYSITPNAVNILIGANGSGKSRLLRRLCADYLQFGEKVIAIAPTIFDRFRKMPRKGLQFYGARTGRSAASKTIRSALDHASREDPQILKDLLQALVYTKFDPVIGLSISKPNLNNLPAALEKLSGRDADELHAALRKWSSRDGQPEIIRLRLESFSFEELDALSFAILARHQELLHDTKVVSRIRYFLFRKERPIPLLEACSGELCFITTIAFISTHIKRRSIIAIDEPETSLHPTWQRDYVHTLLALFHRYEPCILISTHSPIIISGAESQRDESPKIAVSVYEMYNGEPRPFNHEQFSLEEMYDRLFGLITPKSHYVSQRAVEILNAINARTISLDEAIETLVEMRAKSYDSKQQAVIAKIEQLARRLDSRSEEGSAV